MSAMNVLEYAEILKNKHPKIIRSEKENNHALSEIRDLLKLDKRSKAENEYLDLLSLLVESFEESAYGSPKTLTPVELIKELMCENDMSQSDLAKITGSKSIVSEVLSGKRGISNAFASALGAAFNTSPILFVKNLNSSKM
jgi:HTH-type transcriptional regulator/antitoxin HigA